MTWRQSFPAELASVRNARLLVRSEFSDLAQADIEALELLVSELAANAVVHARSAFDVCIDRNARSIRVEVTDHGPGLPMMRSHDLTAAFGRGLRIVDHLATQWGVDPGDDRGKTVWFALELSDERPWEHSTT